jgi:serine/threonine-protein kinase
MQPTRNLQQDLIGRTVSDRYILKGVLGEGGMGTVYEAEHLGLGRQVAIKVLNPSQAKKRVAVKRFQQEARAAGAIGHPNICEVYDLGSLDDGSPYLVMEKLSGTTLADRISREGGLPFDEIADVMIQVLSGLIAAHDKGIVHRDIKPENIFLARRVGCPPIVKILDFGVSKMMPQFQGGEGEQLDLTRTGMVMGTPYYMSPEQARGERNLDGRVDVYACGVMMYESIVGRRPFLAPNYNALLLSIINNTPQPLREIRPATPPGLDAIVLRSMAKARDDRYPSANAVLRDIQALPIASAVQLNRMPAPPTTEERMRAPVVGGGRPPGGGPRQPDRGRAEDPMRSTRGGRRAPGPEVNATSASIAERAHHLDRQQALDAGATLRSRMADAQPPSADNATRLDIKVTKDGRGPNRHESDSIEIPIHVTGSELNAVQPNPQPVHMPRPATATMPQQRGGYEDMPTAIFRPGMHPAPPMVARSPTQTRVSPDPRHLQPGPGTPPAAGPPPLSPVDFSGLVGDEWDSETVVKKPAALTTSRHRERAPVPAAGRPAPQQNPQQNPPAFNPDETVNLKGEIDVDVDFSDETQLVHHQPPRRPR